MTYYENLIAEVEEDGAEVIEMNLGTDKKCGKCVDNILIINSSITEIEKCEVLAEEYGHHKTTFGDITNLKDIKSLKQENLARAVAIEKLCSLDKIINTVKNGAHNEYEVAEMLNITNKFFDMAIEYHKRKHGICYSCGDGLLLYFDNGFGISKIGATNYKELI